MQKLHLASFFGQEKKLNFLLIALCDPIITRYGRIKHNVCVIPYGYTALVTQVEHLSFDFNQPIRELALPVTQAF